MEFKGCGILLTENCNARCKMCCDSRGLVRGKTLTIEELDLILKNIKECPSIDLIGVTGGEPMLYPDLVEHIIMVEKLELQLKLMDSGERTSIRQEILLKEINLR